MNKPQDSEAAEPVQITSVPAVDAAAICSALNAAIGDERWQCRTEALRPEAHARYGNTMVVFKCENLGTTVNWWPQINAIRVWAVIPTFLPGIDKMNWDDDLHCHRLNAIFDIKAALRIINDHSLSNDQGERPLADSEARRSQSTL